MPKESYKEKKINNFEIKPVEVESTQKGNDLFEQPHPNIYLVARTRTGKTTVLYNILDHILKNNDETVVVFFCSKLFTDPIYKKILEKLEEKHIHYVDELSILNNNLNSLVKYLDGGSDPGEIIVIIDDNSDEIKRNRHVESLLKANRHHKMTVIISTQSVGDLPPNCINQFQYVLLFANIPHNDRPNRLMKIHNDLGLYIPYKEFEKMYDEVTKVPEGKDISRNFLYIDTTKGKYRRNFTHEISI